MRSTWLIGLVVLAGGVSMTFATPTPTPLPPPTLTPGSGSGAGSSQLITSNEPAVTLFPFNSGQRAVTFANYNVFATYDLANGAFEQFVALGPAPGATEYGVMIGDPIAITQPNGTVRIGAIAIK